MGLKRKKKTRRIRGQIYGTDKQREISLSWDKSRV